MVLALSLCLFLVLNNLLLVYFLFKAIRGNFRTLERERNVHNAQMNQILDRLAHAEGKPWTLPPRPLSEPSYDPDNDPELQTHWKEV